MWRKIILTLLFSLPICAVVLASDLAKEKRWADQIVDSIMVGEAQWLTTEDGLKFLSLYTQDNSDNTIGGAIILHGIGVHPNWGNVILPLRSQLPEYGWHTLSIQLPILPNESEYKEYAPLFAEIAPRIDAAIKFLNEKGVKNIVLIGHSLGSTMGAYYLVQKPDNRIRALVAVGVSGTIFKDSEKGYLQTITQIKLPVLDIFGGNDIPEVLETEKIKVQAAKKSGTKHYTQIKVPGADHFFDNKDDELVENVRDWLQINASGK